MAQSKQAIVMPNEVGFGFDMGWLFDNPKDPYAIIWGNSRTRELATKVLRENYPSIQIVQSEIAWQRFGEGAIRIPPK